MSVVCFFKQKTAYEMRISAWSSDVCSSDLLGSAVADQHHILHDARRAGDGVGFRRVEGLRRPKLLAGLGVEREQAAVERADEQLVAPHRDAAVDDVAAGVDRTLAGNLGIEFPQGFTGRGVPCADLRPGVGDIHHAVDDDGRRFLSAGVVEVGGPGDAELPYILVIDVGERAEALLVVAVADRSEEHTSELQSLMRNSYAVFFLKK